MKHWYFLVFLALIGVHFPNRLEARLYFIHIQKTGGTSLRLLLESQLSTEEIYPFRNNRQVDGPVKHELVSGHFSYWFCKKLDKNFEEAFKVTILRDPVERYLSFLRARKKSDKTLPDLESLVKLAKSPKHKYYHGLRDNAICRNLSDNPNLEGQELLESAKQTLQKLDCVIFLDNYSEDVMDLFKRLGIDLSEKDIPKINVTEKTPISAKLLEEVKRLNELDIQLYEYAKTNLRKKHTEYRLRTKSFENILKKTDAVNYTFNLPLNGRGWTYREPMYKKENKKALKSPYRWVMDKPAYIYFSLEEGLDYDLYFNAQSLTSEVFPRVSVNGKEIELLKLNNKLFSLYHGKIPKEWITNNATELSFYSSKAFQYRDIYPSITNRNFPPLSFALNKIKISKEE